MVMLLRLLQSLREKLMLMLLLLLSVGRRIWGDYRLRIDVGLAILLVRRVRINIVLLLDRRRTRVVLRRLLQIL